MNNAVDKKNILDRLDSVMIERLNTPSEKSYVSSCFRKGNDYMSEKLLEETNEFIEAIKSKDTKEIIHEAADLWFHSLVALSFNQLSSKDILDELDRRFGVSGLDEKEMRKQKRYKDA